MIPTCELRASDAAHSSGPEFPLHEARWRRRDHSQSSRVTSECRFIGPNAIGTWPAFWLLTDNMADARKGIKTPCDELDIIEAYGGEGPREPNGCALTRLHDYPRIGCRTQGMSLGKAPKKARSLECIIRFT